jgi:hypothetical protein
LASGYFRPILVNFYLAFVLNVVLFMIVYDFTRSMGFFEFMEIEEESIWCFKNLNL